MPFFNFFLGGWGVSACRTHMPIVTTMELGPAATIPTTLYAMAYMEERGPHSKDPKGPHGAEFCPPRGLVFVYPLHDPLVNSPPSCSSSGLGSPTWDGTRQSRARSFKGPHSRCMGYLYALDNNILKKFQWTKWRQDIIWYIM